MWTHLKTFCFNNILLRLPEKKKEEKNDKCLPVMMITVIILLLHLCFKDFQGERARFAVR